MLKTKSLLLRSTLFLVLSPLWLVCDTRKIHFRHMTRDEPSPAELAAKSIQNLGNTKIRGIILNIKENAVPASL